MSATDDKKVSGHSVETSNNPGAMASVGKLTTARISNVFATFIRNWSDSICGVVRSVFIATRESPIGDADYANLPISSICFRDRISSTAQAGVDIYVKKAAGAAGWYPIVTQEEAGQSVVSQLAASDADTVLTAAQLLGGEVSMTPSATRTLTVPAASALLTLMPNAKVGSTFNVAVINLATATHGITVTASASVTNGGRTADFTVAAAVTALFRVRFTNVTAGTEAAVLVRI